ncbi:ASCH domain-containing protein, partial [Klebsiella pneumoniae]|nr:ASCH domain-containing protein [Klebsiella pneumoniae]
MAFLFIDDNEGIFMVEVEKIKKKYPGADAWQMGDSPQL